MFKLDLVPEYFISMYSYYIDYKMKEDDNH